MKTWTFKAGGLVAAAMIAAPLAHAGDFDYLDGYYVNSKVDTDDAGLFNNNGSDDGDGFGVKGSAHFTEFLTFHGEYQSAELDDSESDADQLRAGIGIHTAPVDNSPFRYFGKVEYVDFTLDDDGSGNAEEIGDQNGFGLHAGVLWAFTERFQGTATAGYLDLDSLDGFEGTVGLNYAFTPVIGGFVQYRGGLLDFANDNDNGIGPDEADVDTNELRLGVRWHFDQTPTS